jgi:hypothetical protein
MSEDLIDSVAPHLAAPVPRETGVDAAVGVFICGLVFPDDDEAE